MLAWEDLDAPGPEHEYLIDGLLTVGDKSIIGGPSRSGKSFLSIDDWKVVRGFEYLSSPALPAPASNDAQWPDAIPDDMTSDFFPE
jgi:hypothetical protein